MIECICNFERIGCRAPLRNRGLFDRYAVYAAENAMKRARAYDEA